MVYCGKASQGCKNCRTRRIKCDKVRPECSQCIRVGKKCPGYRDQLSLMFRDESSKVIQKAHAQWGVGDAPPDGEQSQPPTTTPASAISATSVYSDAPWNLPITLVHRQSPATPPSPAPSRHSSPSSASASSPVSLPPAVLAPSRLPTPVDPSLEEQGVQFFLNRYLIGHPDEPRTPSELATIDWVWSPAIQDVMMAVGLASLANLKDDHTLMTSARQRYGMALRQVGQMIQTSVPPSFEVAMRSVVMLAMFELVKGAPQGIAHVHAHIMGGVALLRRWCPMPEAPAGGVRAMVQLTYSLFIPAFVAGTPLPGPFFDWITFSSRLLDPADRPSTDLGQLVARFIQISSFVQHHVLSDGQSQTAASLRQLIDIDAAFEEWERGLDESWRFRVEKGSHLPDSAAFQNEYHIYYDMFAARMWGHYRWARILINQSILDMANNYPRSSLPLVSATERDRRLEIICRIARDTLVSTPTHWRHPLLDDKTAVPTVNHGGAGSGAAGIPIVLFQLQAAACAPGVPSKYWDWTLSVMECIWSDLGMLHAKSMVEAMKAHRDQVQKAKAAGILVPVSVKVEC